jgi:hypothetical protein
VGPNVDAEEILAVNGYRYVGENGLYIAFNGISPLLVRCGAFVSTLIYLVELVGFVRAEGCIVIAAEYPLEW